MSGSRDFDDVEVRGTLVKGFGLVERADTAVDAGYDGEIYLWYDSVSGRMRLQIYSVAKGAWTEIGMTDFGLEVAKGNVTGHSAVNKFGHSPNVDTDVRTDIWNAAAQPVWLAPTAARAHTIVSTSDLDGKTSAPNSVGARTIRIYGLATWASAETSSDITMDGTTGVAGGSWVIIHRMKVLTKGTTSANVGVITATAAGPDNTVTAMIAATDGQTEMAIYGVPSTQKFFMTSVGSALQRASPAAAFVDMNVVSNPEPAVEFTGFLSKHHWGLQTAGTNALTIHFDPPKTFAGPCLIKVTGTGSADDLDVSAWFDGYLVTT